jgi:hypothetical protein
MKASLYFLIIVLNLMRKRGLTCLDIHEFCLCKSYRIDSHVKSGNFFLLFTQV